MRRAFTLVEILVVMALALVLVVLVYDFQHHAVRRLVSGERKESAILGAHAAYQAVHGVLLNARLAFVPRPVEGASEGSDRPDDGLPVLAVDGHALRHHGDRLLVDEAPAGEGVTAVRFFREPDHRVAFAVAVARGDPARSALAQRERAAFYGVAFVQPMADEERYDRFVAPGEAHLGCLGGFPAVCGQGPKKEGAE